MAKKTLWQVKNPDKGYSVYYSKSGDLIATIEKTRSGNDIVWYLTIKHDAIPLGRRIYAYRTKGAAETYLKSLVLIYDL